MGAAQMNIEKQPSLPYKSILGSQLKVGGVYIRRGEVDLKEPTLYHVTNYGQQPKSLTDLCSGYVFSIDHTEKFIEVKAKVVWEHVL